MFFQSVLTLLRINFYILYTIDFLGTRGLEGGSGGTSDVQARVLSTLLNEMDGVSSSDGLIIVGATNRLDAIDPALLRPGRFGQHVQVNLPNETERIDILNVAARHLPKENDINMIELARVTKGLSGAELRGVCREAAMSALRDGRRTVKQDDLVGAVIENVKTQ